MKNAGFGSTALLLTAALVVSGCTSTRIGALQTQPAPAPLNPAPSGTVTGNPLPPPTAPAAAPAPVAFPDAPVVEQPEVVQPVQPVETPNTSVTEVASAQPVTREALVGAWKVSTAGSSCQMFMALTQWTGGYRAASRGCPGDAASVSAWDVKGQQVVLSDSNGNRVATLFASSAGRFDGQTTGGRAISLSR